MSAMTINGKAAVTHATFDVVNPSTGAVFEAAPECTREQLDDAMAAAQTAYDSEWRTNAALRTDAMMELSMALMAATPDIADLLALENGKTMDIGGIEGLVAASWLDYYANLELPREVVRDDGNAFVEVLRKPMGVVAAITPWNMPVGLAFFKIAPALRAGNTVVLKPSPFTPLSTLLVGEVLRDVLPPGVVNIVTGGDQVGQWMSSHPTPRKLSFTGSVEAGRSVALAGAADLKRVTLELGGNDAAIVLEDANVAEIAEGLFWTAFFNNGQACALVKRVYAHASIHDELVEALAEVARTVAVGDPTVETNLLGPLSTLPQFERVSDLMEDALHQGAHVAAGGKALDGPGYYYAPTIVTGIAEGVRLVDEEQFGPVLPVMSFTDEDDAVARANASTFGLGASVWSGDLERGAAVAERLDAGSCWVNTHAALATDLPFGGHKMSGLGIENGPWGLYAYTDIQVLYRNRGVPGPGAI